MFQQYYFVPKESGTLTDTLQAFGLTAVIHEIMQRSTGRSNVRSLDKGGYYEVDAGVAIQEAWIDSMKPFEQLYFVASGKQPVSPELAGIASRNVDTYWDQMRQFVELRKQLAEAKQTGSDTEQALADSKPDNYFSLVTYLGDYRMQAQAIHNSLAEQWLLSSKSIFSLNLRTILAMFATPTVDQDAVVERWKKAAKGGDWADSVTASQLFNPHMGKGQNRAKANGLAMGNEKNFWLFDYLKAVGLWMACAPRSTQGGDVRKTYVLAPKQLSFNAHSRIFDRFRSRLWDDRSSSPIKMDITSALLYADALLEYSVEEEDLGILTGGPISDLVSGLHVATYQLLSQNSYTMMNLSFLGIPSWLPHVETTSDVEALQKILDEHLERINSIDEDTSEGNTLLQSYRNFASGSDLSAFFDFCAHYGHYLMGELERSHFYVKPFSETNLERLIEMNEPKLSPILQNQGFRNIADAIRRSTVIPQYMGRKTSRFDIRYGLGTELKRKARYAGDFVQALSEFMQAYNEETARVYERTKGEVRRKTITTEDISEVVKLVDMYGHKTICNLLVAFGYARDPKEKIEEDVSAPTTLQA